LELSDISSITAYLLYNYAANTKKQLGIKANLLDQCFWGWIIHVSAEAICGIWGLSPYAPLSSPLASSSSVTRQCSLEKDEWIELIFGKKTTICLSYTVLLGNSSPKIMVLPPRTLLQTLK